MSEDPTALAARFERVPYVASLGVRVESIEAERVRVRVPYQDANSNPGKALHGGVAASTVDIAGTLAAWTGIVARPALETGTVDLAVDYLAAAIGEDIVAEAQVLRRGKELTYVDVDVRNDGGKRIAKGLVTHRAFDLGAVPAARERQRYLDVPPPEPPDGEVPQFGRVFVAAPFIARLGMTILAMRDGHAVVRMAPPPASEDGAGHVHEGALAALLDTAGAVAPWSVAGLDYRFKASTVGIHASYHAPATGEVVAEARTLRRNNEIFLNAVTLACGGRAVATGTVTYRIVVDR